MKSDLAKFIMDKDLLRAIWTASTRGRNSLLESTWRWDVPMTWIWESLHLVLDSSWSFGNLLPLYSYLREWYLKKPHTNYRKPYNYLICVWNSLSLNKRIELSSFKQFCWQKFHNVGRMTFGEKYGYAHTNIHIYIYIFPYTYFQFMYIYGNILYSRILDNKLYILTFPPQSCSP